MKEHPLYEHPSEDQGRDSRTEEWNSSEIIEFLGEQYDDPLQKFDVENYEELNQKIDDLGLEHDKELDWRKTQIPNLGEKEFDYGITSYIAKPSQVEEGPGPDDYVPPGIRFMDEKGEVQIEYENNRAF